MYKIKPYVAYCLYDWANSPFSTVVITFIFSAYFSRAIVGNAEYASILWGWSISISAFMVACIAPFIGRHIDKNLSHKLWLIVFTSISSLGAALFWFAYPVPESIIFVCILVIISNITFELGGVVYNSLLPVFSSKKKIGSLSGKAWAVGYAGGILCLLIILFGFVQNENPLFGIEKDQAANIRIAGPIVAIWFIIFSIPLFRNIKTNKKIAFYKKVSLFKEVISNVKALFRKSNQGRFLLSRMIYTDGLNTLFAFGGLYAAGTFKMSFSEIIIFGILINITAGIGALFFSYLDDRIGPKFIIKISLIFLIIFGSTTLIIENKELFLLFGSILGFFIGSVQSSSRSLMSRYISNGNNTETFGLYAISGKFTAFIGPAVLAITISIFDSQRAGMGSIIIFLLLGLILLQRVIEPKSD
ncbi:MFS transporter [Alphaproteobacteria bacterium]|nr:MFS transporter [Alphaproteobacteria bacterium]